MSSRHADHDDKAFTLIEVLIAVTILSGGILAVVGGFSVAVRAGVRAARMDGAVRIAQRELELMMLSGPEASPTSTGSEDRYAWQTSLSESREGLMMAAVVVKWSDRGEEQFYRLSRIFLPRRSPQQNQG